MCVLFFFFFSSRRRHTRCGRDWSSDVCSSDLSIETDIKDLFEFNAARKKDIEDLKEKLEQEKLEREKLLGNSSLRSEEHTSELQSRPHLVCRLLLEKKNRQRIQPTAGRSYAHA